MYANKPAEMNLSFKHPFTCIVSGPTKAGKTTFVRNLIEKAQSFIDPPPKYIWWFYAEEQNFYEELKHTVIFIKGAPNITLVREYTHEQQLVIIDDLMYESNNDILFTRGCHHWNLSVINIVQNIFHKGLRTSRINADYLVLMKNPSDRLQIKNLAHQLYPHNPKYMVEAYTDATREPFSYLLIDLTQATAEDHRLRANIFTSRPVVYTEKL